MTLLPHSNSVLFNVPQLPPRGRVGSAVMRTLCVVLILFICAIPRPALCAQGIQLRNFVLDNRDGNIMIRFSLELSKRDMDLVQGMLQDGEKLRLNCTATLNRKRDFWASKQLAENSLVSQLGADELSQRFVLKTSAEETQDKTLEKLLTRAWTDIQINLGPFSMLQRSNEYFLDLDVTLKKDEVPAWMRWSLFFRSWEAVPGAHYQMNFEY